VFAPTLRQSREQQPLELFRARVYGPPKEQPWVQNPIPLVKLFVGLGPLKPNAADLDALPCRPVLERGLFVTEKRKLRYELYLLYTNTNTESIAL
jgi:hypothetical protein